MRINKQIAGNIIHRTSRFLCFSILVYFGITVIKNVSCLLAKFHVVIYVYDCIIILVCLSPFTCNKEVRIACFL
jgi:hypothetical protein